MSASVHFLPGLTDPLPLCGQWTSPAATLTRAHVTCPECQQALMAPTASGMPQEARSPCGETPGMGWTEKRLLEAVREAARGNAWLCYHVHDSRRSEGGFPDLVLVKPGHPVIFAELKTARGTLSRAQKHWLSVLHQATGLQPYLWRPRDLPAILALLRS